MCGMIAPVTVAYIAVMLMHLLRYRQNKWSDKVMTYPVTIFRSKHLSVSRIVEHKANTCAGNVDVIPNFIL